jgi:hypothetical protein
LRNFLPGPPAATTTTPGQLRRIVHRERQRVLAPSGETLGVAGATHAS